ncbi:MarR family transcriptional regulator [Streptomyces sp. NBC_00190]|uniref:MarR family winged helix-turn-helix transcriptional regulator n=1 Tax=unclassified Streptomyces TaxID=2593676 RepID=UPI002E2AB518|nr:MarR family transcriptional regulator [Streptomyces sp. NBC_00190]WSZ44194.1 MarR family transcriptional regulator [Streptomyces sp. NBC_00868]
MELPLESGEFTSPPADDAEDDRWCTAVRLLGRMERQLDDVLQRRHALPLSEYRAMCALSRPESGGALRMGELAERIGMKDSSTTRLIARLEAQGLAERTPGTGDGRAVTAAVTDAGRERYAAATSTYRAALGAELDAARANVHLADLANWVRNGETPPLPDHGSSPGNSDRPL